MNCCVAHNFYEVDRLLYNVKEAIASDSVGLLGSLLFQNPHCATTDTKALLLYREALEQHKHQMTKGVKPCLCCEEVDELFQNAQNAVGYLCELDDRRDMGEDRSGYTEWLIRNPDLVTFDEWERCVYDTACQLNLDMTAITIEDACKQLEVVVEIQENLCVDNPVLEITTISCSAVPDVEVDMEECKASFDVLVSEYANCDMTFGDYVEAMKCGFTPELIVDAYACGMEINVNSEGVQLCSGDKENVVLTIT